LLKQFRGLRRRAGEIGLLLALILASTAVSAAERVGLVLSGGGARGLAHQNAISA